MRALLVLALLPLVPLASSAPPGFHHAASGTASFDATWWHEGHPTVCSSSAALAVEVDGLVGVVSWLAPACGEAGAAPFLVRCTDACHHDCWVWEDALHCEREGPGADGAWTRDAMTLARDGAFAFTRERGDGGVTAAGALLVAAWPDA